MKTKYLVLGSILAVISALFQCIPALLSEAFIFLTIFSSIPIYIIARKQPSIGILSYIITFVLVSLLSPHENIMFLFTNGIVGLSLGITSYYIDKNIFIALIAGFALTLSIAVVNFVIGINIIGFSFSFSFLPLLLIYLFSFVYCFIFLLICSFLYKTIDKIVK